MISDSNLHKRCPSITTLENGAPGDPDYVVSWTAEKPPNGDERICAAPVTLSPTGGTPGTVVQVNSYNTNIQTSASVTELDGGGYVITWQSRGQDGDSWGIYGQRYDSSGAVVGGELHISSDFTANQQKAASVEALMGGGFAVTYASAHDVGNGYDVFIKMLDAAGAPVGNAVRVNQYLTGRQHAPDILELKDGDLLVTWESEGQDGSDCGIYPRRYDPDSGEFEGDEFQVHKTTAGQQEVPTIAALAGGGFVITWRSDLDSDGNYEIHARRYEAKGGGGYEGNDVLLGERADDTLNGYEGEDKIQGAQGNDSLIGGDGDDLLIRGLGDDVLTGGADADIFSFSFSEIQGDDSSLDFSGVQGDILAFEDVVDTKRI